MRKGICWAALLWMLLAVVLIPADRALPFYIETGLRHEFELGPGETARLSFAVVNSREHPIEVAVTAGDVDSSRSLEPWLEIVTDRFRLAPGEREKVDICLEVPRREVEGSFWLPVYVAERALAGEDPGKFPPPASAGGGDKSRPRLLTQLQYRLLVINTVPGSPPPAGELVEMWAEPDPLCFAFRFSNTGKIYTRTTGVVSVKDGEGRVVSRMDVPPFSTPPGCTSSICVEYEGPELEAGEYLVLSTVDYGGPRRIAGQLRLEIEE